MENELNIAKINLTLENGKKYPVNFNSLMLNLLSTIL